MKCLEAQEAFGVYWDLPEDDRERMAVDEHLRTCPSCREEFEIWAESERLIRDFSEQALPDSSVEHISRNVMDRIYSEQSWFMPVTNRTYQFSKSFRRNVTAILACCMAIFACGLFYLLSSPQGSTSVAQVTKLTGMLETGDAGHGSTVISAAFYAEVPVASISEPIILKVVPTVPQYWLALSMLGIIMTLLILNWFSRTRS